MAEPDLNDVYTEWWDGVLDFYDTDTFTLDRTSQSIACGAADLIISDEAVAGGIEQHEFTRIAFKTALATSGEPVIGDTVTYRSETLQVVRTRSMFDDVITVLNLGPVESTATGGGG